MAAMTSIVGVQLGLASGSGKILNRGAGVSAKGAYSLQTVVSAPCRAPTHCCSEFHGSGVHASSSSVVFSLERSLVKRQTFGIQSRVARGQSLVVRGLFGLGVPELVVIVGVAAILFGPKQLPEIGKSLGKTVKSFQQAAKEFESEVKGVAAGVSTPKEPADTESPETPTSAPPPPPPPATTAVSAPSETDKV